MWKLLLKKQQKCLQADNYIQAGLLRLCRDVGVNI